MRDQLKVQELMDARLNSRDEKFCQLHSQSQEDGAQIAALPLQLQELISLVKEQSKVVERDLEEVNGHFDHHRGEINEGEGSQRSHHWGSSQSRALQDSVRATLP